MRTPPTIAPASIQSRQVPFSREIKLELITRLFGGGARTREIDPVSWLRPAAAKSALRAWWRAGRAHEFQSLEDMRAREQEIFGAPGTYDAQGKPVGGPGALQVAVKDARRREPEEYRGAPSDPLNVALFAASPMGQAGARLVPPQGATATLQLFSFLDAPNPHEASREAFRLWVTLGGVGARTRRGSGALGLAEAKVARDLGVPTTADELRAFLRRYCERRNVPVELAGVFCLARTHQIFLGPPQMDAEQAQAYLLSALKQARQQRRAGSNQSDWPESDAIRLKVGGSFVHSSLAKNAGQYPRAVLGLPIVVHFKDRFPREPKDHQILAVAGGQKLERYASPILLRPVRIFDGPKGSPRYVPVALFTDCTLPSDARPLVVEDPKAPPAPRDIVTSYDLQAHADATLRRVEAAFQKPRFEPLF